MRAFFCTELVILPFLIYKVCKYLETNISLLIPNPAKKLRTQSNKRDLDSLEYTNIR